MGNMMNDPTPIDDRQPDENDAEQRLVARAVQGDKAAIGELLYNSSDELLQFIDYQMSETLKKKLSADDILQETFAVAFRDIERFESRDDAAFVGWLKTISLRRIQDAARHQNRKKRGGDLRQVAQAPGFADESALNLFDVIAVESATPLRNASREEARKLIHVALSQLPDEYREALRLQFMEGLDYQGIAQRMSKSPGAVQGLIKRARQKLRDHLGTASAYLSSR
jgi:RNA polymerase sigma-70 factor (ECF subfamily)